MSSPRRVVSPKIGDTMINNDGQGMIYRIADDEGTPNWCPTTFPEGSIIMVRRPSDIPVGTPVYVDFQNRVHRVHGPMPALWYYGIYIGDTSGYPSVQIIKNSSGQEPEIPVLGLRITLTQTKNDVLCPDCNSRLDLFSFTHTADRTVTIFDYKCNKCIRFFQAHVFRSTNKVNSWERLARCDETVATSPIVDSDAVATPTNTEDRASRSIKL